MLGDSAARKKGKRNAKVGRRKPTNRELVEGEKQGSKWKVLLEWLSVVGHEGSRHRVKAGRRGR